MTDFERELKTLLNYYSLDNFSNTPDFILACYLQGCIETFTKAMSERDGWYGRNRNNPQESQEEAQ